MTKVEEFLRKQKLTRGMRILVDQALKIQEIELRREIVAEKSKIKTKKSKKDDSDKGSSSSGIQSSSAAD